MKEIKEFILERFNYCRAIADDIIRHSACTGVLNHARKFATIETPMSGETDAAWIRVEFDDIFIFVHLDEEAYGDNDKIVLTGKMTYQLDPECAYGAELIDVSSVEEFFEKLEAADSDEIVRHYGAYSEIGIQPGSYRCYVA